MFAPSVTGEYLADSSFIRLNFRQEQLNESVDRFGQLPQLQDLAKAGNALRELARLSTYGPSEGPDIEPLGVKLIPYLTYAHENEHHRIVSTTPFGLAVWRAYQSLRSDLIFLFLQHDRRIFVDFEAICVPGAERFQSWLGYRSIAGYSYVDMVCWECLVLREFIVALLNNRRITRGEFTALASTAEAIMAKRSGIPLRRSFADEPARADEPLVGEDDLTPLEIMEATATLHEESIMRSTAVAPRDMALWQRMSLHGIYEKAHSFFRDRFGFIRFAKLVGDLTFWGPSDIAVPGESLDIDDYFPSSRLRRLADYCEGRVLSSSLYQPGYTEIPLDDDVFGGGIRATMQAMMENPLWNEKFIGGPAFVSPEERASMTAEDAADLEERNRRSVAYGRTREQIVKLAVELRLERFNRFVMSVGDTPFRSLVTIFDDTMGFLNLEELSASADGDGHAGGFADWTDREEASFFFRVLQDYAQNCAVKHAVFGTATPSMLTGGDGEASEPFVDSIRDYYQSLFPA